MDTSKDKEDNNTTLSFPNLQTDIEMHTTFYKDFFGEDKQQPLCDDDDNMKETNPMFRSNSGSFRYMRFKVAGSSRRGSWRSSSLSVMASKSKSRWQVFMFGFGSGKFPTKMDLVDIKTRQLRTKEVQNVDNINNNGVCRDINDGRMMSGKKVWWRLVDVLGCGGGYDQRNNMVLV
ncbi:hypothetical protein QVD17_36077 [Tagetes erecta]|uniref:Uncharacterized protein n=1 Tax=Tagetes erecta TaxID=13708 RepID=A0AAD8JTW1_TARER|nr:hypothetical protein QVD17_36077 [Tagetes erecta]